MNAMRPAVEVPELEHDALMLSRFGHKVSANGRIERRIVAALCAHLAERGFVLANVYDGEETTPVNTAKEAMEIIFNLDESSVRFRARIPGSDAVSDKVHGVLLVLGNGEDIISDWNYSHGDPDGFSAAMEAFDPAGVL